MIRLFDDSATSFFKLEGEEEGRTSAYRFEEFDADQLDVTGFLATFNLGLNGRHARWNQSGRGYGRRRDGKSNRLVDGKGARARNERTYRADIKCFSELEELLSVGVSAANEHRHLQTEPLESSTLFVGLHNADMVVGYGLFNRHSFGTPVLVLH